MMFTFGLAMHLPIWTMNLVVIFRELYIELSSSERYRKYYVDGVSYNYRLGWSEVIGALWRFFNFFNPLWWIWRIFFKRSQEESAEIKDFYAGLSEDERAQLRDEADPAHWYTDI